MKRIKIFAVCLAAVMMVVGLGLFAACGGDEADSAIYPHFSFNYSEELSGLVVSVANEHTLPENIVIPTSYFADDKLADRRAEDRIAVVGIADKAFKNLVKVSSVSFPSTLKSIGAESFMGCTGLTEVSYAGEFAEILGTSAFENCTNLVTVTLGEKVKNISNRAFYNCSKLKTLNSGKLNKLGDEAFAMCIELMYFSKDAFTELTHIGSVDGTVGRTFFYTTCISTFTIPASCIFVGRFSFEGWNEFQTINYRQNVSGYNYSWRYNSISGIDNNSGDEISAKLIPY